MSCGRTSAWTCSTTTEIACREPALSLGLTTGANWRCAPTARSRTSWISVRTNATVQWGPAPAQSVIGSAHMRARQFSTGTPVFAPARPAETGIPLNTRQEHELRRWTTGSFGDRPSAEMGTSSDPTLSSRRLVAAVVGTARDVSQNDLLEHQRLAGATARNLIRGWEAQPLDQAHRSTTVDS